LRDNEHGGRARILKLKDWPTKKDFASVFPTRLHDLMNHIPFSKEILLFTSLFYLFSYSGDYTRRSYTYNGVTYHGGVFNIVERLPACLVKPDLGPKLYIAYSKFLGR
jgi:lysine-specific demethylase 3